MASNPTNVSVGIPVGPRPGHRRWLEEALDSCAYQTLPPDEVILVMDSLGDTDKPRIIGRNGINIRKYTAPWRLGPANAFNHAVGLSRSEFVFLLGSDDTIEPTCLEECMKAMLKSPDPTRTIVWTGVRYMKDGKIQNLPCGAMLVSRSLWRFIGGYPLETAVGAQDWLLLSALQGRGKALGIQFVQAGGGALYNYRTHPDTENEVRKPWWPIIEAVHKHLDATWEPAAMTVSIYAPISAGELLDKITILRLKSERIDDGTPARLHVVRELEALEDIAGGLYIALQGELFMALTTVNYQLWQAEDVIRQCLNDPAAADTEIAWTAREIVLLNDRRASTKRLINAQYGSDIVEEKVYSMTEELKANG